MAISSSTDPQQLRSDLEPVNLSPLVALRAAFDSNSFGEFMAHLRSEQGDAVVLDLQPFAPKTYLLMGKAANRDVLSSLDVGLEQILQELINVLPVAAKVPSEVDVPLQRKVASLFQSEAVVNERLPSFGRSASEMQERWASLPSGSELEVFCDLSEYVLLSNLEVVYGRAFREAHSEAIEAEFAQWVENIAAGKSPIGFFRKLGELLRGTITDMQVRPDEYDCERSVLSVYLESGALGRHDEEALVGLLSMTLMAAVFNTQVSLAWILTHLYSDAELLQKARDEIASASSGGDHGGVRSYAEVEQLPFLNSCIDEAVRLHTMLPGNTVLRKTKREMQLGSHTVEAGAVLWLYPNAVHLDAEVFDEPKAFCPMRLLHGELERMQDDFELVTFGHGRKRCIGEKMARAQIITFLMNVLPKLDADTPDTLPEDGFFDLVPASELRLYNLRPAGTKVVSAAGGGDAAAQQQQQTPFVEMAAGLPREFADFVDIATDMATDVAKDVQKKAEKAMDLQARRALWEFWLWLWQSWVNSTELRLQIAKLLWPRGGGPRVGKSKSSVVIKTKVADLPWADLPGSSDLYQTSTYAASRVDRLEQLEQSLAMSTSAEDDEPERGGGAPPPGGSA